MAQEQRFDGTRLLQQIVVISSADGELRRPDPNGRHISDSRNPSAVSG